MALTEEMVGWMKRHTRYDGANRIRKHSISAALEDFWRRQEKIKQALAALPSDNPLKPGLEGRLKAVTDPLENRTDASDSDLKNAYKALAQLKKDAQKAAGDFRTMLDPAGIAREVQPGIDHARRLIAAHQALITRIQNRYLGVRNAVLRLAPLSNAPTREAAFEGLPVLREQIALIEADLAALETEAANGIAGWKTLHKTAPTYATVLADTDFKLKVMREVNPKAATTVVGPPIATLTTLVRDNKLESASALEQAVAALLRQNREDFDGRVRPLLDLGAFANHESLYTKPDGTPMTPQETALARQDMEDRFRHLEAREAQRLEKAKEAYEIAVTQDRVISPDLAGRRPGDRAAPGRPEPQGFDPVAFFLDLEDAPLPGAGDKTIALMVARAGNAVLRHVTALKKNDPGGDELFDMAMKTRKDWIADILAGQGLPGTLDSLPVEQQKYVNELVGTILTIVETEFPNRAAKDFSTVTLNGASFDKLKKLGNGAMGEVWLYENKQTGEKMVLKTSTGLSNPKRKPKPDQLEEIKEQMAREARNHRQAMGANGQGHPNLTGMKGAVMGPYGEPLIAMELADGGDASGFADSMGAAAKTGLISETARQALVKESIREITRGLKQMHDNNVTHFDLKTLNVFMAADGTMKVGDLGIGGIADSRHGAVERPEETTPTTMAPEFLGEGEMSDRSDAFSLGAMLDMWADEIDREGEARESFRYLQKARLQTTDGATGEGEAITATALDRLRNALMEEDPDKRPSMDAVLFSSYLSDTTANYTPEDVAELRAAQAAYAKAAGKLVADHNFDLNKAEAAIRKLELEKQGREGEWDQKLMRGQLRSLESEIRRWTAARDNAAPNSPEWAQAEEKRSDRQNDYDKVLEKFNESVRKGIQKKNSRELAEIDKKIAAQRDKIRSLKEAIGKVHADPQIAPVVQRLERANVPFLA